MPRKNIFKIKSDLSWDKLGTIPETYFTAYGSLFECLKLKKEDTLLIRGATCPLGYATIKLAKALGCKVIGTTHKEERLSLLDECDKAIIDDGNLSKQVKADKILELIGPKTLRDSLKCLNKDGIVCQTGLLGKVYLMDGFDPIKEIPNGCYLTGFFSNYPSQEIIDSMMSYINKYKINPTYGAVYKFADIKQALIDIDNHKVDGKTVIVL